METGGLNSTGAILVRLLAGLEWGGRIRQNMALGFWPQAVGPVVAAACTAEEVRDGVLYVRTPGSTWSQELSLLKHEIIPRLNQFIGAAAIHDIKFRAGRKKGKPDAEAIAAPTPSDLAGVELTEEDRAALADTTLEASNIADDAMRAATLRLAERAVRLRRWRLLHGWQPCPACGALQPDGTEPCTVCQAMAEMPTRPPRRRPSRTSHSVEP